MVDHYILDSSNNPIVVTNLFASNNATSTLGSAPLGTVGASTTGEVGLKVLIRESAAASAPAAGATSLNTGALNLTTSQVTAGVVATLVAARPTRRSVLVCNAGSGTDVISVGEATVTTTHGTRLTAGQSCAFTFVGLIQVLAITGTPVVTAADEYD